MSENGSTGIILAAVLAVILIFVIIVGGIILVSGMWWSMPHMGWFMWWFMLNHILEPHTALYLYTIAIV